MANPPNHEFFEWLADRLVHVYGESPNTDFVHRLREEAKAAKPAPKPFSDAELAAMRAMPDWERHENVDRWFATLEAAWRAEV